jgi:hypothetical protein
MLGAIFGHRALPTRLRTPMRSDYKPELDTSPELAAEGHSYYQELIGILRWAVELGRMDILLEVSLMSTYFAAPREGHWEQVFHIFGYLKKVPKKRIAFDPDYPEINESRFKVYDWNDFYRDAEEAIPSNAPEHWAGRFRSIVLWMKTWRETWSHEGVKRVSRFS